MPAKSEVKAGDAISVYWPDDHKWYDGQVESINVVSRTCEVLYDDGERALLNLLEEKYKVKRGGEGDGLIDRVRASNGDVSKQLKHIGAALIDMSDRLPPAGCWSYRKGWWTEWYSGIRSAVEAGNVIALVKVTFNLACLLRHTITTPWWTAERKNWHGRLRSVKTCEGLVNCVQELRLKAVDWTKAKELFPENLSLEWTSILQCTRKKLHDY